MAKTLKSAPLPIIDLCKQGGDYFNRNKRYAGNITSLYNKLSNNNKDIVLPLNNPYGKDTIQSLEKLHVILLAISKTNILKDKFEKTFNLTSQDFLGDCCTALNIFITFINESINTQQQTNTKSWLKDFNNALKEFKSSYFAFNGSDSLIKLFSNNNPFCNINYSNNNSDYLIKYAVENSFFFERKLTITCFNNLSNKIHNNTFQNTQSTPHNNATPIDVRKSTQHITTGNNTYFLDGQQYVLVKEDMNGNNPVCKLIKNETGYTVSQGYDCNFILFKISHIWGNAIDPWYFTSLWNIVLTPIWANDFLDKTTSTYLFCQQILATYKAICYTYYDLGKLLKGTPVLSNIVSPLQYQKAIHGTYNIQIISQSPNAQSYGKITTTPVTI